jgi:hypothetical protein
VVLGRAVTAGEPPGRWYGDGAAALVLAGLVDEQDMTALYEQFIDPRDELFSDPTRWAEASTLGHTGRNYPTEDELYAAALDAEPGASPERREELRLDAGKRARKNVAFLDATFSVQKSVTVLHTAFEAQQVAAERTAGQFAAALDNAMPEEVAELTRHWAEARTEAESWRAHAMRSRTRSGRGTVRRWTISPSTPGIPGSASRRRRRAVRRRAWPGRRVVLPARLARPRPAVAHPQRDPQPRGEH